MTDKKINWVNELKFCVFVGIGLAIANLILTAGITSVWYYNNYWGIIFIILGYEIIRFVAIKIFKKEFHFIKNGDV